MLSKTKQKGRREVLLQTTRQPTGPDAIGLHDHRCRPTGLARKANRCGSESASGGTWISCCMSPFATNPGDETMTVTIGPSG